MESTNNLIGITGKSRNGKDTIADYLVQEYAFARFTFADLMKQCLARIPGWGLDQIYGHKKDKVDPYYDVSPWVAMQWFGYITTIEATWLMRTSLPELVILMTMSIPLTPIE